MRDWLLGGSIRGYVKLGVAMQLEKEFLYYNLVFTKLKEKEFNYFGSANQSKSNIGWELEIVYQLLSGRERNSVFITSCSFTIWFSLHFFLAESICARAHGDLAGLSGTPNGFGSKPSSGRHENMGASPWSLLHHLTL
jgi:hypothetical protein